MRAWKRSKIRGTAKMTVGACDARSSATLRDAAREHHLGAERQRQVVAAGALEHVRQRQHRQEAVVGPRHAGRAAGVDVGDDVAVRQHHALGPSRRCPRCSRSSPASSAATARDLDGSPPSRGQERSTGRRAGALRFGVVGRAARRPAAAAHRPSPVAQGRRRGARSRRSTQRRLGVADAPRDVVGVVVDVERHDDEPEAERREVDRDPARRRCARTARPGRPATSPSRRNAACQRAIAVATSADRDVAPRRRRRGDDTARARAARGAARKSRRCCRPCVPRSAPAARPRVRSRRRAFDSADSGPRADPAGGDAARTPPPAPVQAAEQRSRRRFGYTRRVTGRTAHGHDRRSRRSTHLSHKKAKDAAQKVAEDLQEALRPRLRRGTATAIDFERPGLTGAAARRARTRCALDCKLGFLLTPLKPAIEREIHKEFDKRFGKPSEHRPDRRPPGRKA